MQLRSKEQIKNPFTINRESEIQLVDSDSEFIIEMSCDTALKENFDKTLLMDFWLSCHQEYPFLAQKAIKFLMPDKSQLTNVKQTSRQLFF